MPKTIKLEARVFVEFSIQAQTGLHIGGTNANIEIGGVDKAVIRDVLTNQPYIPGSSLKGKMRSLLEKYGGLEMNYPRPSNTFHACQNSNDYAGCDVCNTFGISGEFDYATPTRIVVRDIQLNENSAENLSRKTDLPYTEVKSEVSIDRVTSAANPRQMERVPAGAVFGPSQIVYSIYSGNECDPAKDIARLATLLTGMQLLEDDYLGGLGTRGSGRVAFKNIAVTLRSADNYLASPTVLGEAQHADLADLTAALPAIQSELKQRIGAGGS